MQNKATNNGFFNQEKIKEIIKNVKNTEEYDDGKIGTLEFIDQTLLTENELQLLFEITWSNKDEPYSIQNYVIIVDKRCSIIDDWYWDEELI